MPQSPKSNEIDSARARIHQLIRETIRRREAGETVSDNAVIRAHADLMPGLGQELRKLGIVETARRRSQTDSSPQTDSSAQPDEGGAHVLTPPPPEGLRYAQDRRNSTASEGSGTLVTPTAEAMGHPTPGGGGAPSFPTRFDFHAGYKIVREIHRGGQGIVYEALQRGTRRKVAIKVLRDDGLADGRDRVRFEREIQILGRLKHPNVVAIYNSGTVNGRFFYVMDYVEGLPIDQYIQVKDRVDGAKRPSAKSPGSGGDGVHLKETVLLFLRVCDAVHAAHLQGVIHRDLKPGNILVDADGHPHVVDFGLAKAYAGQTPAAPTVTATGEFVGSLPWASPEQASGRADVDLRTDVYSLGVVLYHMLTGVFPYAVAGSTRDVINNICESPPEPPRRARPRIDDEVETIVLKCLAKERGRRYQSAGEIAADLRRHLDGEAIEAKRDSGWYVLRKTVQKYKLQTAFAAVLLALVLTSALAMTVLYRRAEEQAGKAMDERDRAVVAEQREAAEAVLNREVVEFLVSIFEISDPDVSEGNTVTAREILDAGAQRIDENLQDQPLARAAMLDAMGRVYRGLGLLDQALPLIESALEIRTRELGEHDDLVIDSMSHLAEVLFNGGDWDRSEKLYRDVLAARRARWGEVHPSVAASLADLGDLLRERDEHEEAETVLRQGLAISKAVHTDPHPDLARDLNGLGQILLDRDKYLEAEPFLQEALRMRRQLLGDNHTLVADTVSDLGWLNYRLRRLDEAEALFREALALRRKLLGRRHPIVSESLNALGAVMYGRGDIEASIRYQGTALSMSRRLLGDDHPTVAVHMSNLAMNLDLVGQSEQAEALHRQSILIAERHGGSTIIIAGRKMYLGRCLIAPRKYAEAEAVLREALQLRISVDPRPDVGLAQYQSLLGEAIMHGGCFTEAETYLLGANDTLSKTSDDELEGIYVTYRHRWLQNTLERLVTLYDEWGEADEADHYRALLAATPAVGEDG